MRRIVGFFTGKPDVSPQREVIKVYGETEVERTATQFSSLFMEDYDKNISKNVKIQGSKKEEKIIKKNQLIKNLSEMYKNNIGEFKKNSNCSANFPILDQVS